MLIDNNILIDVALNRPPDPRPSRDLISHIERTSTTAFVAWHSVATFYYVVARATGNTNARFYVAWMTDFLIVVPTGTDALRYALSLPMADFEDAMQVAAAQAAGAGHVVTRDIGDFTNSPIPAVTPEQALRQLF